MKIRIKGDDDVCFLTYMDGVYASLIQKGSG